MNAQPIPKDQSQMGKQDSKQTQVPPQKKGPVTTKGGKGK